MKYPIGQQTVDAVYDNIGTQNPLIEALPVSLSPKEFFDEIGWFPVLGPELRTLTQRKAALALLPTIFVPLNYMYNIYDSMFRMLESSYHTMTSRESAIRINSLFAGRTSSGSYGTQAQSGALLGTPGIGKTTTTKRCLSLLPQVIAHEKYLGTPFYTKQILWLYVECPSDASQKTMAFNIVRALDQAVGGNHLDYLMRSRSTASSAAATYIKILCMTYHVGLLVIDEIQNVVSVAKKAKQIKPLIRFLTELTNDTCTAVYFVGTTMADDVFASEEYLRRRTRGPRLLPFKPDAGYREFLNRIWQYQVTEQFTELTDNLAKLLFTYSGGIPAYITSLFMEAQAQALLHHGKRIDKQLIAQAADYLTVQPPSKIGKGMSISDFRITKDELEEPLPEENEDSVPVAQFSLAPRRGRKSAERETIDLLVAYKNGTLHSLLKEYNLIEELVLC